MACKILISYDFNHEVGGKCLRGIRGLRLKFNDPLEKVLIEWVIRVKVFF
jgi:hypothetical protein